MLLDELISGLVAEGLGGLEVYSSSHKKADIKRFRKLAKKYDLAMTCGSDYHGSNRPHIDIGCIGINGVCTFEKIEELKARIQ